MSSTFEIRETQQEILVSGWNYRFGWNRLNGRLECVEAFDGLNWNRLLPEGCHAGFSWLPPVIRCEIAGKDGDSCLLQVEYANSLWRLKAEYTVFARGYVICDFSIEALSDISAAESLYIGIPLDEEAVFSHAYRLLNLDNDPDSPRAARALSVDFSTDGRPVTNSVNFLLESVMTGMNGSICQKVCEQNNGYRYLGWLIGSRSDFPGGWRYTNRWCLTLTGLDNRPNRVRGQRIYHWYGHSRPLYLTDDILVEMAEYGCSLLALHMPVFSHIAGSIPKDGEV
ncbi:MAG: hypothetical protein PHT33_15805, partial [bacterium]|nr:hypothetical protein [bacterium]